MPRAVSPSRSIILAREFFLGGRIMVKRISRRTFLKAAAAPLGIAAANALLPPFMAQAASSRIGTPLSSLSALGLKDVPRNRTLIHAGVGGETPNQFTDAQTVNPFLPGISRG